MRRFFINAKLWLLLIALSVIGSTAQATTYLVGGTTLHIYAQSASESTAHLIGSSKGIYNNGPHPWCGNRAYINFADTALFATALAASLAGRSVNLMYEDAAPSKTAAGHITFGCKVVSIWW
jgi:hypothetical protein